MEKERTNYEDIKPITPEEVAELQKIPIPPEVIKTFNRLLGEKAVRGHATLYMAEIQQSLSNEGVDYGKIFRNGWDELENMYRKAGWSVRYDRPGYNESYKSFYVFKPAQQRRLTSDD